MSQQFSSRRFTRQFLSGPTILNEGSFQEELQQVGNEMDVLSTDSAYLKKSFEKVAIPKRPEFNPPVYPELLPAGPTSVLEVLENPVLDSTQRMKDDVQFVDTAIITTKHPKVSQLSMHTTLSMIALRGIAQLEKLATIPVRSLRRTSQLDNLGTIPVAVLKGVEKKSSSVLDLSNARIRIAGIVFVGIAFFYISWLVQVLNTSYLWFSLPFFFANLYTTCLVFITIYNNWHRSMPLRIKAPKGQEPTVAVLIPTYGEPIAMLQATIESVLTQEWPDEKLVVVVGDDSHKEQVREMVETLQISFLSAHIIYHEPPRKGDPSRNGSAKDGNLNSMLAFVTDKYPNIAFIETRDADDIVGNPDFLRYSIGHLLSNPVIAYVQTIKEALVSPGDPFGNRQTFFYRGVMFARHAANAVFPCGSGLVWRKEKLDMIGGFPTWNLVEDLYSGYLAMQHGLIGAYLPIVGAIGQVSPEDIPNVYKQLGTWALDTVRLFIWKNPWLVRGLTFKQKMQFTELGMFYLMSFSMLIFVLTPVISLFFGIHPFNASNIDYIIHFWLYAGIIEILLAFIGDNSTFEEIWRARQMWIGMIFVYAKASVLAITYGPDRKPIYRVTRKTQQAGLYFRETLFQILLFLLLLSSIIYNFATHPNILKEGDFGSMFWILLYMLLLLGIIGKSWYGVRFNIKP